jgi:hypothetical protein
MLVISYILLTVIRDDRSNFAADIWMESGFGSDATVFTKSELPASLVVLVLMGMLILIRNNIRAFLINHIIIIAGLLITLSGTLLYLNGYSTPFWWMTLTGIGLYISYVPFNCMLFERLIASFKHVSNAGFIIYVADSFGYLGSDVILVIKNFARPDISWTNFFTLLVFVASVAGLVLIFLSAMYFNRKHKFLRQHVETNVTYA